MNEIPQEIRSLIGRCEVGEDRFSNDDLSLALKFGELTWSYLNRMQQHYEKMSELFVEGDIRGPMMAQAAKDMQEFVFDRTRRNL